ncbi:hypothetical protein [Saezia sanguinis]|uniref:hypothetical protein n=1 Tax=Saezia sanguinis TaxID=1965230 RepID=UPI0030DD2A8F
MMKLKLKKLAAAVAAGVVASTALVAHAQNIDRDNIYTADFRGISAYQALGEAVGTPKQICDLLAEYQTQKNGDIMIYTTVDALVKDSWGATGRALYCQFDTYHTQTHYTHHHSLIRYAPVTQ